MQTSSPPQLANAYCDSGGTFRADSASNYGTHEFTLTTLDVNSGILGTFELKIAICSETITLEEQTITRDVDSED